MEAGKAMVARRDTGEKAAYEAASLPAKALELLDAIQKNLYDKALAFRRENTKSVADRAELLAFYGRDTGEDAGTTGATGGFAEGLWCGSRECEAALKAETKVTIRCLPLDRQEGVTGACCLCGKPAHHSAIFARNY
jgi:prolyl-tRNA synthetase